MALFTCFDRQMVKNTSPVRASYFFAAFGRLSATSRKAQQIGRRRRLNLFSLWRVLQKQQLRIAIAAAIDSLETLRNSDFGLFVLFKNYKCVPCQPSTFVQGGQGEIGQSLGIGRIEKGQREGVLRRHVPEFRGITPEYARDAADAQRFDIGTDETASLRAVVDKQGKRRTARQCFKRKRACSCEQVDHARALQQVGIIAVQYVEYGFAQTI